MLGFIHRRSHGETLGFGINWSVKIRRIIIIIPFTRWHYFVDYDSRCKEENVEMRERRVIDIYFRIKPSSTPGKFNLFFKRWNWVERVT